MWKGRERVGAENWAGGLLAVGRTRVKGYIQSGHSWNELLENRKRSPPPTHTFVFQNDLLQRSTSSIKLRENLR